MAKAREVLSRAGGEGLIIAADTLVYLDGRPLGKPSDEEDAKAIAEMFGSYLTVEMDKAAGLGIPIKQ